MRTLSALLHYYEPVTRRVGCEDTRFLGVLCRTLCQQTGLDERRLSRALSDLQRGGLIKTFERAVVTADGFRGRVAVRVIADKLFQMLDLVAVLHEWRAIAARKLRSIRSADVELALRGDAKAAQRLSVGPRLLTAALGASSEPKALATVLARFAKTGPPQT